MVIHEAQGGEGRAVLLFGHEAFGDEAPLLELEIIRVAVVVELLDAGVQPALDFR